MGQAAPGGCRHSLVVNLAERSKHAGSSVVSTTRSSSHPSGVKSSTRTRPWLPRSPIKSGPLIWPQRATSPQRSSAPSSVTGIRSAGVSALVSCGTSPAAELRRRHESHAAAAHVVTGSGRSHDARGGRRSATACPTQSVGDPTERLVFYARFGATVLDLPYFQPRLSANGQRAHGMLLIAFDVDAERWLTGGISPRLRGDVSAASCSVFRREEGLKEPSELAMISTGPPTRPGLSPCGRTTPPDGAVPRGATGLAGAGQTGDV